MWPPCSGQQSQARRLMPLLCMSMPILHGMFLIGILYQFLPIINVMLHARIAAAALCCCMSTQMSVPLCTKHDAIVISALPCCRCRGGTVAGRPVAVYRSGGRARGESGRRRRRWAAAGPWLMTPVAATVLTSRTCYLSAVADDTGNASC